MDFILNLVNINQNLKLRRKHTELEILHFL